MGDYRVIARDERNGHVGEIRYADETGYYAIVDGAVVYDHGIGIDGTHQSAVRNMLLALEKKNEQRV